MPGQHPRQLPLPSRQLQGGARAPLLPRQRAARRAAAAGPCQGRVVQPSDPGLQVGPAAVPVAGGRACNVLCPARSIRHAAACHAAARCRTCARAGRGRAWAGLCRRPPPPLPAPLPTPWGQAPTSRAARWPPAHAPLPPRRCARRRAALQATRNGSRVGGVRRRLGALGRWGAWRGCAGRGAATAPPPPLPPATTAHRCCTRQG